MDHMSPLTLVYPLVLGPCLVVAARQAFNQLFTIGSSLYALSQDDLDLTSPMQLLRVNTVSGALTHEFNAFRKGTPSSPIQTCGSLALDSATSLYALCVDYTGSTVGVVRVRRMPSPIVETLSRPPAAQGDLVRAVLKTSLQGSTPNCSPVRVGSEFGRGSNEEDAPTNMYLCRLTQALMLHNCSIAGQAVFPGQG